MAIENHRFDLSEQRVFTVNVTPSNLDHSDFGVAEIIDDVFQKVRRRNEIRVKNRNHFALRELQPILKSAGFEPMPIGAVNVMNVEALFTAFRNASRRNLDRTVR